MDNVQKTTPSQDLQLAWLAGIFDGEGSIGLYQTKSKGYIIGIVVVNTDPAILARVEKLFRRLKLHYSKYSRAKYHHITSFSNRKECFDIKIARRDDAEKLLPLLIPHLVGEKKKRAQKVIKYLKAHPRFTQTVFRCSQCDRTFTGRKRKYCSLNCWHAFAKGTANPNYRHGKCVNQV